MRVLVCSETFKGTLEAPNVGKAVLKALGFGEANGRNVPLSDGGAGFLASMTCAKSLRLVQRTVVGPAGTPVVAQYGLGVDENHQRYAVVEMALASGLPLLKPNEPKDILRSTSFGLGQLLSSAMAEDGVRKVFIGLGGSATNDGAVPALQALGYIRCRIGSKWYDQHTAPLCGGMLKDVEEVEVTGPAPSSGPDLILISDVTNPLLGKNGATEIYGPQKGATTPEIRAVLEKGLLNLAEKVQPFTPTVDIKGLQGGGAAGGAGAFLTAVARCQWTAGAIAFAKLVSLTDHVKWADVVFTGEGSFDTQTLEHGKTISHVRDLCRELGKPLIVICGRCTPDAWGTINNDPIVDILTLTPRFPVAVAMKETERCIIEVLNDYKQSKLYEKVNGSGLKKASHL